MIAIRGMRASGMRASAIIKARTSPSVLRRGPPLITTGRVSLLDHPGIRQE